MESFIIPLAISMVVLGSINGILTLVIKSILKKKGINVTFLYLEISDIKEFYKIHKENVFNRYTFLFFLMCGILFILDVVVLITLIFSTYS
ncbi:MAG: hypothetical protein HOO91_00025 [Bacteroidales bacterium]|nr:hypothetical protein [Bacteroidales bacterium]